MCILVSIVFGHRVRLLFCQHCLNVAEPSQLAHQCQISCLEGPVSFPQCVVKELPVSNFLTMLCCLASCDPVNSLSESWRCRCVLNPLEKSRVGLVPRERWISFFVLESPREIQFSVRGRKQTFRIGGRPDAAPSQKKCPS